ncbi:MAG TPA: FAD-dependent oxidoreductase [Planctomycetaceae bacterium]|nr:FAD-dependent oxidoreductase [Planctomycetaceae bacterium]
MARNSLILALAGAALFPAICCGGGNVGGAEHFDVVVYGGTSAGVTAAIQVARMHHTVVLIEPGRHIGGLTSGGLGATDIGNKAAIGGLSRSFYQRVRRYYDRPQAWKFQPSDSFHSLRGKTGEAEMWVFEPHVAELILREMLSEAHVPLVFGERLDPHVPVLFGERLDPRGIKKHGVEKHGIEKSGVEKHGPRIVSIRMQSGRVFAGSIFIDATYEGDLMAKAGVSYRVGREANSVYGETLNGVQVQHAVSHQFVVPVDPYIVAGNPAGGLLPGIEPHPPAADGTGDSRVQAYCFRLCMTDVPENRIPWPKPADYDPRRYELLLRNFEAGDYRVPWKPDAIPNRKTDTNNNFAVSIDDIGTNYAYPDGDDATRARIIAEHTSYEQGLFWTLAHSPRVPPKIRATFERFGLAADEFVDNGHWPHQLYVREARRMVSDYVMTQHDCQGKRRADDSVGLAAYTMDSHNVERYVRDGRVWNEGDVQVGRFPPYPIAYRSLCPKKTECTNLLVPTCPSASHIAFGSIRMEPVFMVLGQSAATAGVMAIESRSGVQDVEIKRLQQWLLSDGQILRWK